jgi:hypothetical protein
MEIPTSLMPDHFYNENDLWRVIYALHPTQNYNVEVKNKSLYPVNLFCIMKPKFINLQFHKRFN